MITEAKLRKLNAKLPSVSKEQQAKNRKLPPLIPAVACLPCYGTKHAFVATKGTWTQRNLLLISHFLKHHYTPRYRP